MRPHPIDHSPWIWVVLAIAAGCEAWATVSAFREHRAEQRRKLGLWAAFRASKDLTTYAVLFENGAALLGVVVAFAGILASRLTGSPYPDASASIVIGAMLAVVAFFLIRESRGLLIGESINPAAAQAIRALVAANPNVEEVLKAMTMQTGAHEVLLVMDVRFCAELTASKVVDVIDTIERAVRTRWPEVTRIFIEADRLVEQQRLPEPGILT
jgi:divalent metal cation (Fe/Co/Zn/Cd) transporter